MKHESPREVALYATIYVTLAAGVLMLPAFVFFTGNAWVWALYPITLLAIFFISLYTLNYAIERFIYRKIRLIYKSIHRLKTRKNGSDPLDFSEDVLSEVNKEVIDWAKDNEKEIDMLKAQEEYRKEFIGNLSHELKTPIFTIQGYILTLLEGGLDDPQINQSYLERADKNLDRLISLINELDEITRLESGQTRLNKSVFDAVELVREVMEESEYKAKKAGVLLTVKDPKKKFRVSADRGKINQVLTNLIMNSVKYGKEGGNTRVKFYDMEENVMIEVEDDGIGITEEHLPRLFERFYRVDKSRARHQGGSGLGLAIVKHILDAHGHTINVRSKEGQGSTFTFTLDKAKA